MKQAIAIVGLAMAGLLLAGAGQAQPVSGCSNFDNQTLQGWGGPGVGLSVAQPGRSGLAGDYYMRGVDQSGTSYFQAPASYLGNWTGLAQQCGSVSVWVRWFDDGTVGSSLALTPSIVIQNGTLRAAFRASFTVSEDSGPNPGWHYLLAPLGVLGPGNTLPSNGTGAWQMLDGAPNTDWPTLLSNVTLMWLPIEASSFTETAGYDDICLDTGGGCPVPVEQATWGGVKVLIR